MQKLYVQIRNLWFALEGKKTYLLATIGTLVNLLVVVNPSAISQAQLLKIDGILIALGGAALRAGINKV